MRQLNVSLIRTIVVIVLIVSVISLPSLVYADDDVLNVRGRRGATIKTLDPAHMKGNEEFNVNLAIYSRLTQYKSGTTETKLDAAKSLKVSEDGTVITFKLREGIKFHKGYGEMTAEDVKFSFERIIDPEENSTYKSDWAQLDHVEITGKYSGKIILKNPMPSLLTSTIPFTSGAIISKKAYKDLGEKFATNPVGSGPYMWKKWEPNQKLVLERFDDYYGEKPDFRKIEIYPIEDVKSAELMFQRGDLGDTRINLGSVERFREKVDCNVQTLTPMSYHWLGFNTSESPFNELKVRKAIKYAISVEDIIIGAYDGLAPRNDCMISPQILGYWEKCPEQKQNIEKAKELLAEAGYPDGLKTTLYTSPPQFQINAAQLIQEQLRNVDIKVNINVSDTLWPILGEKSPPGMHYYQYSGTPDPGYWFEWFTCGQVGGWNYWEWCNEKYDELHKKASTIVDREERGQLYIEMQEIIAEEVPAIFVTNGVIVRVTKKSIKPSYLGQYSQYRYFGKVGQ